MEPTAAPSLFGSWNNPTEWNLANYLALAAIVAAVATPVLIELVKWLLRKHQQKLLENQVDDTSYPRQVIENATRYYVRPRCSNIDPAQEAEIRNAIPTSEDLFQFVDEFLEGRSDRMHTGTTAISHLIVLADSGMGKTSFVLNYLVYNGKKRLKSRKRLAVVHLGTPDALDRIRAITKPSETDLFLDAFDEDTKAVETATGYRTRMEELFAVCSPFNHVIITCRTQFFPRDAEIPTSTGNVRIGPRAAGEGGHYDLWKIYLNPLTDKQVDEFLTKYYPGFFNRKKRKQASATVKKIPLLSARPMLLTYIPDLLESNIPINHTYQLYEIMVEKWLEREKGWIAETDKLRKFSEDMAVEIYTKRQERGGEVISATELVEIAQAQNIGLDGWKLTGRSLLNRNAEGDLKFAHRSIMEYLFIKRYFAGDVRCQKIEWTDLMKIFFMEQLKFHPPAPFGPFLVESDITGADLSKTDFISLPQKLGMTAWPQTRISFLGSLSYVNFTGCLFDVAAFHFGNWEGIDFSKCAAEHVTFSEGTLSHSILGSASV